MKWQPWEEDFLRLVYPDHTNRAKYIEPILNRSMRAMYLKARSFKIKRKVINSTNPIFIAEIPEMLIFWNINKNEDHPMYISCGGDNTKYWFTCINGHDYISFPWRVLSTLKDHPGSSGCPYCKGTKISAQNCLTNIFPTISKQWDYKKNNLTPYDVSYRSYKKVWWICRCGHSWKTSVGKRTVDKNGCPACANKIVTIKNCLATIYPEIAKEWHPIKNKKLTPNNIASRSGRKTWWICKKCNHEWRATVSNRTLKIKPTHCPKCNESKGEKRIASWLNENNIEHIQEHKPGARHKGLLRYDFFLPNYSMYIEYHGQQHYKEGFFIRITKNKTKGIILFLKNQLRDKIKEQYCRDNNLQLKIIPYTELNNIEQILETFINGLNNE